MSKDKKFFHGHERLAEERGKIWKTQQEAADFFGVSRVTWGQCERGNATPSADVLAGLAQKGANVLYILTGQRTYGEPAPATVLVLTDGDRVLLDNFHSAPAQVQAGIKTTLGAFAPAGAAAKRVKRAA